MTGLTTLSRATAAEDQALAARHCPVLMCDARDPFAPQAIGWSVHHRPGPSPSCRHPLDLQPGEVLIEYAIWYDWDIQHLYDLEHVWVRLHGTKVIEVSASCHGARKAMDLTGGLPALQDGRPVLYVEAGKHAHWADPVALRLQGGSALCRACGPEAGQGGVHTGNPFHQTGAYAVTPLAHRLAKRKLAAQAFVPAFCFAPREAELMPWAALADSIPARVQRAMATLETEVPHLAAVFLDCGDTLIDESTETKRPGTEVVLRADTIPGAVAAVQTLAAEGYRLVLVADGPRETFENLLRPLGLWDLMQGHVISGDVGALKPDRRMFDAALAVAGLTKADAPRVVMVGNNLARDIRGAKALGLKALLVGWSKRRSLVPQDGAEVPDARIDRLEDLPAAIAALEASL